MKMQHITIHSARYEESIRFYRDVCGLSVAGEIGKGKGPFEITFLGSEEGGTQIEIINDAKGASKVSNLSIGFAADDAASYREQLIEKGYDCTPLVSPMPGVNFFFVKDPNGIEIQFI